MINHTEEADPEDTEPAKQDAEQPAENTSSPTKVDVKKISDSAKFASESNLKNS